MHILETIIFNHILDIDVTIQETDCLCLLTQLDTVGQIMASELAHDFFR